MSSLSGDLEIASSPRAGSDCASSKVRGRKSGRRLAAQGECPAVEDPPSHSVRHRRGDKGEDPGSRIRSAASRVCEESRGSRSGVQGPMRVAAHAAKDPRSKIRVWLECGQGRAPGSKIRDPISHGAPARAEEHARIEDPRSGRRSASRAGMKGARIEDPRSVPSWGVGGGASYMRKPGIRLSLR